MPQSLNHIRSAYDLAAEAYTRSFLDELNHKPLDIELMQKFARTVGIGQSVLDLGCGPGHTTAHLHSIGLKPVGVDLSPEMVAKAGALFPGVEFTEGNFLKLEYQNDNVAGLVAFYCIVHLQPEQLPHAFSEMNRVLKPGGILLLSFHIGSKPVVVDSFLDTGATLEFFPHPVATVEAALKAAGFADIETHQRPPYETEYPTERCYIFAHKRDAS